MLKIITTLDDYSPWSGAIKTFDIIKDNDMLDDFEFLIENCYPEGITQTQLNDILWFDSEWVLEQLGLNDNESEEE